MKTGLIIFSSMILATTISLAQLSPQAVSLFSYDRSAPLDVRDSLIEATTKYRVYDISYASPRIGRVTGFIVAPAEKGTYAGIVFGHWGPGNRTEFLPEGKLYAQAGAVSLMIDYPWVRPAQYQIHGGRGFDEPEKDLAVYSQAVVDLRRGIDVLISRPDVDSSRIAYVGHSYGAQWGAILSAVDDRIKATVLMAGVPSDSVFIVESNEPNAVAFRESASEETRAKYMRVATVPLAAIGYVPYARPTPLFFQFAAKEREISLPAMKRYYDAASEPKSIKWYDTGHELNDPQALIDRAEWLRQRMKMGPVKSLFQKMLK